MDSMFILLSKLRARTQGNIWPKRASADSFASAGSMVGINTLILICVKLNTSNTDTLVLIQECEIGRRPLCKCLARSSLPIWNSIYKQIQDMYSSHDAEFDWKMNVCWYQPPLSLYRSKLSTYIPNWICWLISRLFANIQNQRSVRGSFKS